MMICLQPCMECLCFLQIFLYGILQRSNLENKYRLVEPGVVAEARKSSLRARELAMRMEVCNKGEMVVFPYNANSHWMLVVADPYAQCIYFFDPLGLDPREDLRLLIPMAFKIWLAQKGMKWKNLTWNCVNCPKQPSNTESGYYVMKYMKDIFNLSTTKLEKVFGGRKDYSIKEIDEMRGELAKFIMDIVNEDTMC